MSDQLFDFQVDGAAFLTVHAHALLADEMGLGKSAQAIRAADAVKARAVLVICPASAKLNWAREFGRFGDPKRQVAVIERATVHQNALVFDTQITSFDFLVRNPKIFDHGWDAIIIDEAHFLKEPTSQRARAVLGKTGVIRQAKRVWLLTGTPCPNNAAELWPMLYTFGRTSLKYEAFIDKFCHAQPPMHFGGKPRITGTRTSQIPQLQKMLDGFMIRRRKTEVMKDMPPIHFGEMVVEASQVEGFDDAETRAKLEAEYRHLSLELGMSGSTKHHTDTSLLKALEYLARATPTLRRFTGMQKVKAACRTIKDELDAGQCAKLVIFAIHRDVIWAIKKELAGYGVVSITGTTPSDQRQWAVDEFQNNPAVKIFVGNIKAAGTAITLTAAHQMVFFEQDWVPGENIQAAMRCHRIGQSFPVFVRFVQLANSLDQRISAVLRKKANEISSILGD